MKQINVISRRLRIAFLAMFYIVPILTALSWLFFETGIRSLMPFLPDVPSVHQTTINATSLTLGFLADLFPTGVVMLGLYLLAKLFKNYEHGNIFSKENSIIYSKLARVIFAKVSVNILFVPLCTAALTFQNARPHDRLIFVTAGGLDLVLLFVGLIVLIVAWVMEQANQISQEQSLTI